MRCRAPQKGVSTSARASPSPTMSSVQGRRPAARQEPAASMRYEASLSPCRIIATVRSRAACPRRLGVAVGGSDHSSRSMKGGRSRSRCPLRRWRSRASRSASVMTKIASARSSAASAPACAERPGAARALSGARGLRHDVGNARGVGDPRADPIRRLVVDVIGEPEAWPIAGASVRPARDEAIRFGRCCCGALHPGRRRRRPGPSCAARLRAPGGSRPRRAPSGAGAPWCGRRTAPDGPGPSSARRTRSAPPRTRLTPVP